MTASDLLTALAAENPLPGHVADELSLHLAEMELLEKIMEIPAAPVRERVRPRRVRRRRPAVRRGLLASAAAIGAAVAAIVLLWPGTGADGPSPAVAAVMNRLSQIAASGPSLVPRPGQYLALHSVSRYPAFGGGRSGEACVTYAVDHRELWIAADGSGLLRESSGPATFPTAADRARCHAVDHAPIAPGGASNLWFADQCFELGPGGDPQSLSTDPRVLLEQMRRVDGGPRTPAEDFVHVGDFLRETDASPKLRAALFQAAALIPGVRSLGVIRDHRGRKGLGIAMTTRGVRHELIFNRRTAALMGEQGSGTRLGAGYWAVYFTSRVVDSHPYPSPVPLRPACHHGMGYSHNVPGGTTMTGQPVS